MINKNKLVSIVLPSYNAEEHLNKSIGSVIKQSYSNFELIVVDDGSSDNSYNICKEYASKDNRIRVFLKENGGPGSARNYALNHLKGKYVVFIDADDFLTEDAIEKLVYEIEKSKSDFVCSGHYKYLNGKKEPIIMSVGNYSGETRYFLENISKLLNAEIIQAPWAKIFRRDIINSFNIRFPEYMFFGEDTIFVYEYLFYVRKISMIESPLYYHTISTGSLRNVVVENIIEVYIELYSKLFYLMKSHKVENINYIISKPFLESIIHGFSVIFRYKNNLKKINKRNQLKILINSKLAKVILTNFKASGIQNKVLANGIKKQNIKYIYLLFSLKEIIRYYRKIIKGW